MYREPFEHPRGGGIPPAILPCMRVMSGRIFGRFSGYRPPTFIIFAYCNTVPDRTNYYVSSCHLCLSTVYSVEKHWE